MAKFYTDGKDDMIVYKFSTRFAPVDSDSFDKSIEINRFEGTSETKYVDDKSILDKTVADFTRRYFDPKCNTHRSDANILFDWKYDNFVTTCSVGNVDGFLAEFKLEEIHIPNSLFSKMSDTINYRFPDTIRTPYSPTAVPQLHNDIIVTNATGNSVRNAVGSQIGIYNASTSADAIRAVKSPNFVETFNVANYFGNFSRVPVTDTEKYHAALNEAETSYGDHIADFIVPDVTKLTKTQCSDIVKDYDELKKNSGKEDNYIPVVFDLATYSTKIVSEFGTGPTVY